MCCNTSPNTLKERYDLSSVVLPSTYPSPTYKNTTTESVTMEILARRLMIVIGLISEDKFLTMIARQERLTRGDSRAASYRGSAVSLAEASAGSVRRNLLHRREVGLGDAVLPTKLIVIPERPHKTQKA